VTTKKSRIPWGVRLNNGTGFTSCLERLGNESRTDAAGTNLNGAYAAVALDSFDFLKVRIPDSTGFVVRMTDVVSEAGAFSANFTFS
jgi:hypothetical protein